MVTNPPAEQSQSEAVPGEVTGRLRDLEAAREAADELRAAGFGQVDVRDPRTFDTVGDNREPDATKMSGFGRRILVFGTTGTVAGALLGLAIALGFTLTDDSLDRSTILIAATAGFAFVGLALGAYLGLGSRLVVEDEARDDLPEDAEDYVELSIHAGSEAEREQISAILGSHGVQTPPAP